MSTVTVEHPQHTEAHVTPLATEVVSVHPTEAAHHAETTKASNAWLDKTGNKVKRWLGHAVRLIPSELAINWGTGLATYGTIGAIMTGGALTPLAFIGAGGALAAGGAIAEWKMGMKHAKSPTEKDVFWLSKVGQTLGSGALSTLAILGAPAYPAITTGMYTAAATVLNWAGIGMGVRAISHRK